MFLTYFFDNTYNSEHLLFISQTVWVLKSKIFSHYSTYSKETTILCKFNCWLFVKNWVCFWKINCFINWSYHKKQWAESCVSIQEIFVLHYKVLVTNMPHPKLYCFRTCALKQHMRYKKVWIVLNNHLMNCQQLNSQSSVIFFQFVDFWPKKLLFFHPDSMLYKK